MRIVSLLPSATEILFAIGVGHDVVGVTHECDYPAEARKLPHLTSSALPSAAGAADIDRHVRRSLHEGSSIYRLDADLLERLAPDLILTQELCAVCAVSYEIVQHAVKRVRGDPRVVSLEPSSLADVWETVAAIGRLTGADDAADKLVERLRRRARGISDAVVDRPRPTVLVLEWTDPPMGAGHWTPDLAELAGGRPVLANPHADSQRLDWDAIAAAQPDLVVVAPCGLDLHAAAREVEALARVPQWRAVRAVAEGQVALVDGNAYVNRPGPRLIESAEIFASVIHPEAGVVAPSDGWRWLDDAG